MRHVRLALACASALALQGSLARADTWTILEGRLQDARGSKPLSGSFDGSRSEDEQGGDTSLVVRLDDFAFQVGRRALGPRIPVEYDGLVPIAWLQVGDAILVEGEQVTFVRVRTGGKLVDESDEQVTFRFLELRADASHGGYALGRLGDTDLPRRLALKGDVYEVEQSFGLPGPSCSQPPTGGSPGSGGNIVLRSSGAPASGSLSSGGAIAISSGSEAAVQFGSLDVQANDGRRTFVWESPSGESAAVTARVGAALRR